MSEQAILIRFGIYDHVSQLREEGLLYMKNLPYLWHVEDKHLRGDPSDSVGKATGHSTSIIILRDNTNLYGKDWAIIMSPLAPDKRNIVCNYLAGISAGSLPVDGKTLRFADCMSMIKDPQSIDKAGLSAPAGLEQRIPYASLWSRI